MKLIANYRYWILNFVGWICFALLMLTLRKVLFTNNDDVNRVYYLLIEGVLCGFLGFLLSFIILYFIEYHFKIDKYNATDVLKLIAVVLLVQVLYSVLLWPMLDIPAIAFYNKPVDIGFDRKLWNMPHFFGYYLVWLFVVLTIKLVHHINTIKLNQLRLESHLKEAQLNTLKGQINPHFMFNSLNNIRGLMLEDVSKSRHMLTTLSETLRYSLTKSSVNAIALEDELEMVENYVSISKIQFENRLEFQTSIDENTLDKQIPPMIIQMLVENALKHGISNLKKGGLVMLKTAILDHCLLIEVSNSGRLAKTKNSTQLGINNIKKRLELLYGKKALFTLADKDNNVVATIKIPLV